MGQARLIERITRTIQAEEIETLLGQLIAIESHDDVPDKEWPVASFIREWFEKQGIHCELQTTAENRPNVIARISGSGNGRSLMLNGHMDTVPGYGMKQAFTAVKHSGRIYGRGSVDMKGAVAVMMTTLAAVKRSGLTLHGDLIFAATAGEESYSPGAWHLANSGMKVDRTIVGEPTDMQVGVAHKGVAWFEGVFPGLSVHGSVPEQGINAIYRASRWINHIVDVYIPKLWKRHHPLLGTPSLNIGMIEGGTRPVIVPGECKVRFERRLIPGETEQTVLQELQHTLEEVRQLYPNFAGSIHLMDNFHGVPHGPLESSSDSDFVKELVAARRDEIGHTATPIGLQYWTDGALLQQCSEETIVCGPGNIEQAHSDEEYIEIKQLHAAFRIYIRAVLATCMTTK